MRIALVLVACVSTYVCAQDSDSKAQAKRKARASARIERYKADAKGYVFYKAGKKESPENQLKLVSRPLMTYSDPSPGGQTHQGAFFIWTHLGRPEIIASIWSMGQDDGVHGIRHEFHSLSTEALAPKMLGRRRWAPVGGLKLKPVPGAKKPSKSKNLRLAQMRSLAKEFTGFTLPPRANGREWRMRTAGQPIYRYESEDPQVVDGGIFVIFADWDPEMFLLIEARKVGDELQWQYTQARLNSCPLRLEHKNNEVWKVGSVPFAETTANYFMVGAGDIAP